MSDPEDWSRVRPGTASVWAGELEPFAHGVTQVPVFHGVTYGFRDLEEWTAVAAGRTPGHVYSRSSNPTVRVFEEKLRVLEGAPASLAFATGMSAVSATLFGLLRPGERVVSIRDSYGGTSKLFLEQLPAFGIEVELCETADHALETALGRGARVLYLESPTNPTLKVLDLERLARAGHAAGATVVVDNTFATPINQRPLALGADLVLHSATKFLGGHSDAMGGVVCGGRELVERLFRFREVNGAALDPMSAYLLIRGLKTLELRVARHNANAQGLAEFLAGHPKVEAVFYPGLASHPGHELARRQMKGFGGVFAFVLRGGAAAVAKLLPKLRFAHRAASLGSTGSLVGPPETTSHVELSAQQRKALGIPESLVRYSTGIENLEDLVEDLEAALAAV